MEKSQKWLSQFQLSAAPALHYQYSPSSFGDESGDFIIGVVYAYTPTLIRVLPLISGYDFRALQPSGENISRCSIRYICIYLLRYLFIFALGRASLFKIQRIGRAKELVCTGGAPRKDPKRERILFTSDRFEGSKTTALIEYSINIGVYAN